MSGPLANAMRLQAHRTAGRDFMCRYGIAHDYNPNTYKVKVTLQPEGIELGALSVATAWSGNGWGAFSPPTDGDQLVVAFIDGDLSAGVVLCRRFNNTNKPLAVPQGEYWLVHKNGGFFKLTNDGKVAISDGKGATLTMNGDGTITVQGKTTFTDDAHFNGNVNCDKTVTGNTDVVGGGKSLKTHPHLPGTYVAGSTPVTGISGTPQ